MRARAFTLPELLVTMALIALLVGIAVPVIGRVRESANTTKCLSHLRQLGISLNRYLGEHDGRMPVLELGRKTRAEEKDVLDTVLAPYVGDARLFACPSDQPGWDKDRPNKPVYSEVSGTSYFWNSAINGQAVSALKLLTITDRLHLIPLIGDKEGFHRYDKVKTNVLYADGHAANELKFRTEEEGAGGAPR